MTPRTDAPIVYLITAGGLSDDNFDTDRTELLGLLRAAVESGVPFVQIREKMLSADRLCELAADAVEIVAGTNTKLLINDRAEIAAAVGANGVHLTSRSMPAVVVKRCFPSLLIGVSAHTESEIAAAQAVSDLVVYGPVFDTPGKGPALGVAAMSRAAERFPDVAVVAVGGIDQSNWRSVLETGAAGFAAIRWLSEAQKLMGIMRSISDGS